MSAATFHLKVHSFRTFPTPLDDQGIRTYNCVTPVTEIPPEFLDWMEINARKPALGGRVPKAIRETLDNQPENFIIYNRGLAILADAVEYDNRTKVVTLSFTHKKRHGVFDGGHTLNVIQDKIADDGFADDVPVAYCKVEISTGVPVEMITDIVEARNTSRQVASKSLLNLGKRFEELKTALGPVLASKIAWMENEEAPIDVRELVGILTTMDRQHYNETQHPLYAYTSKEQCLKHFESSPKCYEKCYPIAKDLLRLWDELQAVIPDQYNSQGGRFGKLTGCKPLKKPRQLHIIGGTTTYPFPTGYLYPIVAAFRSMLTENNGVYAWGKGIDPCKLVRDGLGTRIFAAAVVNSISAYHNPNKTGKDPNVWSLAYQMAENYYLKI